MNAEHGPDELPPTGPEDLLATDPRLAEFVDALRGPATPAELAAQDTVLDLMASALAPATARAEASTAKDRRFMKSHLARTIALATAGVLSVGGVAAAATGTNPLAPMFSESDGDPTLAEPVDSTTTTSTTTSSTTTVVVTTTGVSIVTTTTAAGTTDVDDDEDDKCPKNHGEKVSAVAKDKSNDDGQPHGKTVSEAARTKDDECDDDDDDEVAESADDSDDDADDHSDDSSIDDHDDDDDDDRVTTTAKSERSGSNSGSDKSGSDKGKSAKR